MKYKPSTEGRSVIRQDYSKKIVFSPEDFDQKGHLLQVVTIPPNTRQRAHLHEKQTEVFYILEGEAVITFDGADYPARPGDAFVCSPGDVHSVWNQADRAFRLVVFKIDLPEGEEDSRWLE